MQSNLRALAVSLVLAVASAQSGASIQPAERADASASGSPGNAVSDDKNFGLEQGVPGKPTLLAMQFDLSEGPSLSRPGRAVQSPLTLHRAAGGSIGDRTGDSIGFPQAIVPTGSIPKVVTDNVVPPARATSSIPEPPNWAMVLAGLLSVGAIARRRLSS